MPKQHRKENILSYSAKNASKANKTEQWLDKWEQVKVEALEKRKLLTTDKEQSDFDEEDTVYYAGKLTLYIEKCKKNYSKPLIEFLEDLDVAQHRLKEAVEVRNKPHTYYKGVCPNYKLYLGETLSHRLAAATTKVIKGVSKLL